MGNEPSVSLLVDEDAAEPISPTSLNDTNETEEAMNDLPNYEWDCIRYQMDRNVRYVKETTNRINKENVRFYGEKIALQTFEPQNQYIVGKLIKQYIDIIIKNNFSPRDLNSIKALLMNYIHETPFEANTDPKVIASVCKELGKLCESIKKELIPGLINAITEIEHQIEEKDLEILQIYEGTPKEDKEETEVVIPEPKRIESLLNENSRLKPYISIPLDSPETDSTK